MRSAVGTRILVGAALLAMLVAVPVAASYTAFGDADADAPPPAPALGCDHTAHIHPSPAHTECGGDAQHDGSPDADAPHGGAHAAHTEADVRSSPAQPAACQRNPAPPACSPGGPGR